MEEEPRLVLWSRCCGMGDEVVLHQCFGCYRRADGGFVVMVRKTIITVQTICNPESTLMKQLSMSWAKTSRYCGRGGEW